MQSPSPTAAHRSIGSPTHPFRSPRTSLLKPSAHRLAPTPPLPPISFLGSVHPLGSVTPQVFRNPNNHLSTMQWGGCTAACNHVSHAHAHSPQPCGRVSGVGRAAVLARARSLGAGSPGLLGLTLQARWLGCALGRGPRAAQGRAWPQGRLAVRRCGSGRSCRFPAPLPSTLGGMVFVGLLCEVQLQLYSHIGS